MNVAETVATEPKPKGARMERFNIVLPLDDSEWLDRIAWEIREKNGAKISRSEIVRAAIAGIRELHLQASERPSKFVPLAKVRSRSDLRMLAILAARLATDRGTRKYTRVDGAQPAGVWIKLRNGTTTANRNTLAGHSIGVVPQLEGFGSSRINYGSIKRADLAIEVQACKDE